MSYSRYAGILNKLAKGLTIESINDKISSLPACYLFHA